MNSKKSWLFFVIAVIIGVGVFFGVAKGAQQLDVSLGKGLGLMLGSIAAGVLGVYLSWKLKKA